MCVLTCGSELFGGKAMNNPNVDEVRRVRDAHAAIFNYNLDAIFLDIKEQEKKSGLKFVSSTIFRWKDC
jgi:hypothetical protein